MVALNLERYYFVFQLFGRSRRFMVGGLLTTGSEAESASVCSHQSLHQPEQEEAAWGVLLMPPSDPRDPVLHLPTTPAHSRLYANIPLLGKKKQRNKNAVRYFGEYPGSAPLALLEMIERWCWDDSGSRLTDLALVLFPVGGTTTPAQRYLRASPSSSHPIGCILGITLIKEKGVALSYQTT